MRAVLDTNVLVSALMRPDGVPGRILARLVDGAFAMVLSAGMAGELRRAARYPRVRKHLRVDDDELEDLLTFIETLADPVRDIAVPVPGLRDPADGIVVAAAVEGRADVIVTGDDDLLAVGRFAAVEIVTPRAFLRLLAARGSRPEG